MQRLMELAELIDEHQILRPIALAAMTRVSKTSCRSGSHAPPRSSRGMMIAAVATDAAAAYLETRCLVDRRNCKSQSKA
jgi:hypothetical protein